MCGLISPRHGSKLLTPLASGPGVLWHPHAVAHGPRLHHEPRNPGPHVHLFRVQGLSATLLRNTPANSVYLGSFEVMKQLVAQKHGCKTTELSAPVITACAGGSWRNVGGSRWEGHAWEGHMGGSHGRISNGRRGACGLGVGAWGPGVVESANEACPGQNSGWAGRARARRRGWMLLWRTGIADRCLPLPPVLLPLSLQAWAASCTG